MNPTGTVASFKTAMGSEIGSVILASAQSVGKGLRDRFSWVLGSEMYVLTGCFAFVVCGDDGQRVENPPVLVTSY